MTIDYASLKQGLPDTLHRFHRNSCYPEAMDAEIEMAVTEIVNAIDETTAPVTGEVGEIIKELRTYIGSVALMDRAAAALQRLTQEVERLEASYAQLRRAVEWDRKIATIVLAERDAARSLNTEMREALEHIAKQVAIRHDGRDLTQIQNDYAAIRDTIRAILSKTAPEAP